jgi:hypothetical protein
MVESNEVQSKLIEAIIGENQEKKIAKDGQSLDLCNLEILFVQLVFLNFASV